MSNKLTWADVAPYYAQSTPIVSIRGAVPDKFSPYFYLDYHFDATELPVLREWDSITDEEAFELLNLVGGRYSRDEVEGSAAEFKFDYAYGIEDEDFEMTAPALHWFVKHNFNPFGVPTYKETNP